MNVKILLLALTVAALSSCTTSYKTGQTPDDVYFSPARPQDEYVRTEDKKDDPQYRYDDEYYDNRYLRMKVHDRNLWSDLDDWYYSGTRYNYSFYNSCNNNPWTPYSYWNSHYNPYYHNYIILNPKTSMVYNSPRMFNLNTYNSNALTTSNYTSPKSVGAGNNTGSHTYTAPRNSTNADRNNNSGNLLRDLFKSNSNSSSSNNSSGNSSSNSNSSNSNSSSNSSSGSGSSAPVRRF